MPEGHTIHRLAARHRSLFAGQRVALSSPQGRFAEGAALLSGTVLASAEACGKHLLHHYASGLTVHVHLGLYGQVTDGVGAPPPPVGQIRMRMVGGGHWLDLRGPTDCSVLSPPEVRALRARLGADPLRPDADPSAAIARISRSNAPIAALLLDQSIFAGVGLVYASEALFRAAIGPTRPGRSLSAEQIGALWTDLRGLMAEGVTRGRIDTVHSAHLPEAMGRAPRVDRHGGEVYVYRRTGQPCLICGTPVARAGLAGRNSYWCPTCQASGSRRPTQSRAQKGSA
ncbi:zinc finger domain-containing protein [Asanoa sp. WMMD1127]|uniref:Fpg/Nei family DNA glycosylase n=1 Tax=Asanoa sp. WMMD1127 TaxID=3016107 RepID=UPI002417EEC2|nr:zinc finger domain-containing protein [Asanoa sp. WMMD1127]MDG4822327.1 zinc finger domain-containing protein [Asanoa sp. WMMD1127]